MLQQAQSENVIALELDYEDAFLLTLQDMNDHFEGFLKHPWRPSLEVSVFEDVPMSFYVGVHSDHLAEDLTFYWGIMAKLQSRAPYILAHELTHTMISRKLWELNPQFLEFERWLGRPGNSKEFSEAGAFEREFPRGYFDSLVLDGKVTLAKAKLYKATRHAYEEIIADIPPLLMLGGQGDVFAKIIAEMGAFENLLSEPSMDSSSLEPLSFSAMVRDMDRTFDFDEIDLMLRADMNEDSEIDVHILTANTRSRIWKKVNELGGRLTHSQIFNSLVLTLEAELSEQYENGFYLKSGELRDLTVDQIKAINNSFVLRFNSILDQEAQLSDDSDVQKPQPL